MSPPRSHWAHRPRSAVRADRRAAGALGATLLAVAVGLLALAGGARAAGCTDNWTNTAGGAWSTATDWSEGTVPGLADVACITLAGTYTVTMSASASVGSLTLGAASGTQTLEIEGSGTDAILHLDGDSTINQTGELVLDNGSSNGFADVEAYSGTPTLTNNGTVKSTVEGIGQNYLEINLENASGGKLEVASGLLQQDFATTTTNDAGGTVQVDGAGVFELTHAGGSVVNSGSVVNNGTFSLTGGPSWTQSGGALSGSNPVAIQSGSLVDSAGTGQFVLTDTVGLSGTIPLGQTVTVSGGALDSKALITGNVTNNGTLVLDQPAGTGFADVQAGTGTPTLTNNGTVKSTVEGIGQNYLEINLENASGGKLEVASGLLQQDFATTTTNDAGGTVQVDGAGVFELTHAGGSVVNSGSVVNNGTFSLTGGPSWTQSGGALSGSNPVAIQSGSLVDSAGTGQFVLTDTVGLSGTIPLGQTVTVSGGALDSKALITGNVTNNGTLVLDQPAVTGFADVQAGTGTPKLTNNGTVKSTVEGIGQNYRSEEH